MQPALVTLDYKKPVTPLKTENYTIEGFENSGIKLKCSKTWGMKWHWLRDKEVIKKLSVYWDRGKNNDNDCFKKYHPPIQNHQMQPQYIHT